MEEPICGYAVFNCQCGYIYENKGNQKEILLKIMEHECKPIENGERV